MGSTIKQKLSDDLKPAYNAVEDSYAKNISASGIKFIVPEHIPTGTFLELHIRIPTAEKFIAAIGKVVRCEAEDGKNFGIAITFIWINKKDKDAIDKYVKNKRLEELRSEIKE